MIDLRSDTVTRPTPAMRKAMAEAEVGDDVWGDDPTVLRLQEMAAAMVGKEAALFVPSGTMGNLSAVLAHCHERGSEVIVGDESHIFQYEADGVSVLGGVGMHTVPTADNGELPLAALSKAVRADDQHCPRTSLVCIESSHNRCGGCALSLEYMRSLKSWADDLGLPVHLDGARVFNAAVALGVDVTAITELVTSVQFCLSKGLGAPVGSIVAGPKPFIARVHRLRKMLGGGMRQVGVLAAPGLLSLTESTKRLQDDHDNALLLAKGLASCPHIDIRTDLVHTNIVIFNLRDSCPLTAKDFIPLLQQHGVLIIPFRGGMRAVTHYDVSTEQCEQALQVMLSLLNEAESHAKHVSKYAMTNGTSLIGPEAKTVKGY
ncbi:hypothetical protein CVIRNUC_010348 [Coccomyxa viridis]|uniref:Aromatic amino acid beta-eliminating lyase/threonine aldolase domain-containing protein n=1 Tax=Coccomyxa viridis TaxID=1274662 RepID=A0AAV1IKC8_9CHLO|nr:hypothetical protein CVIRNUC_010348 [Coccomyxa viridis]